MKISEAKVMEYGRRKSEVLYETAIGDYKIVVVNFRGEHPNAYVKVPARVQHLIEQEAARMDVDYETHPNYLCDMVDVWVHGGMTYNNECLPGGYDYKDEDDGGYWYGWDYAHAYDYVCYYDVTRPRSRFEKEWTTDEIIAEALFVVKLFQENYEE